MKQKIYFYSKWIKSLVNIFPSTTQPIRFKNISIFNNEFKSETRCIKLDRNLYFFLTVKHNI